MIEAIDRFVDNMVLLNEGADVDFYKSSIDAAFERICGALLKERSDTIWYDGTGDLSCEKIDNQVLVFKGNMHVMDGQKKHWREPFVAEVTLSSDQKSCYVSVSCGEYSSTGNLHETFGYKRPIGVKS